MQREVTWEGASIKAPQVEVSIGPIRVKTDLTPEEYAIYIEKYQAKALEVCQKMTDDLNKTITTMAGMMGATADLGGFKMQ